MKAQAAAGSGIGLRMGLFAGTMFALVFAPTKREELRAHVRAF